MFTHASATLTVQTKNVMQPQNSVGWILAAPIGPTAVIFHLALKGRGIVILTLTVKEDLYVGKTIVKVDQLEWTVVKLVR